MHVNELDVRQLLELLSRRSGLNILVSPKVSGTITANFEGSTIDEVLKAVIKLANLVEKKEGTIHYLYSKGEIDDDAEVLKREKIITRVYKLNYVRSDEMLTMIRPFLSVDVGQKRVSVTPSYRFGIGESATFVSGGAGGASATGGGGATSGTGGPTNQGTAGGGATMGGFQPPTGGNSMADSDLLVVQDYESNLKIIDQIIERIDKRPHQVLIEAVIISVELDRTRELGVNFSLVDTLGTALGTVGSGAALNSNVGFNPTQLLTTAGKIAGSTADPTGFTSASNGAKFGFVANNVTGFIQALETIGSTKILASPRILVLNKQRAEIQLGQRLGFQTFSQNFTSTIQQVQFLNTGTLLRIRPFISEDGMIRMELHPERSSGTVVNNVPNQNTAELTTNIMVPDGATLVIGGLMEDEDDYSIQGLPGLSRMPALGFLFGARQKSEIRRELVVLLTPHIWSVEHAMAHGPMPVMGASPARRTISADTASNLNAATDRGPGDPAVPDPSVTDPPNSAARPDFAVAASVSASAEPTASALARTPGTDAAAVGANRKQQTQDSQRRRGFFRSFVDRVSRRSDSQSGQRAQPKANSCAPDPSVDPSSTPRVVASPTGAPIATRAPSPIATANSSPVRSPQGLPAPADAPITELPGEAAAPANQPGPTAAPVVPTDARAPAGAGVAAPVPVGAATNAPGRSPASVNSARFRAAGRDGMVSRASWEMTTSTATESRDDRPGVTSAGSRTAAPYQQPARLRTGGIMAGPRRHSVGPGETFASIAELYYGSTRFAKALWWVNRGKFKRPEELQVGDLVLVPAAAELETPPRGDEGSTWARVPARRAASELLLPMGSSPATSRPHDESSGFAATEADKRTSLGSGSGSGSGEYGAKTTRGNREEATSYGPNSAARDADGTRRRNPPVHVVRPKETLRSIARDRLGDSRRADEIAALNQDRLVETGVLAPGQRLLLPSDASPVRESR